MKWLALLLVAAGLAGCASQPARDDSGGQPQTHAQAVAQAHTELAASYYQRTQYSVALDELNIALQADPGYASAYNVRGLVHMQLLEDQQADADFRHSLRLDPGNSDTQNNYGWFLCQRGHAKESVPYFLRAVQNPLYPTPQRAYLNAGICSQKAGETRDAELYFRRALARQPNMPEALLGLAGVSYAKGNYPEAGSFLLRFEKWNTSPLTAEALWLAVRIERKLGDVNAEASYAAQLRKNYPDSVETQLMLQPR